MDEILSAIHVNASALANAETIEQAQVYIDILDSLDLKIKYPASSKPIEPYVWGTDD
jgi:hypothetical protein